MFERHASGKAMLTSPPSLIVTGNPFGQRDPGDPFGGVADKILTAPWEAVVKRRRSGLLIAVDRGRGVETLA